ncbi:alpha/beta fold hydrolase [Bradyrhizobium sp. LM6.9]
MPSFHNGAVEIAYLDEGEGDPIILVHGFASSKNVNWVYPTWVSELRKNGRRVIALDNRGHGESAKLYEPSQYSIPTMGGDVLALMDHLAIPQADLMGYSMGGRMTAWLSLNEPQRLRSAILGGIGIGGLIEGKPGPERTWRRHWKRPRSTTSPIPSGALFVLLQTKPVPTARHSPPACAARATS